MVHPGSCCSNHQHENLTQPTSALHVTSLQLSSSTHVPSGHVGSHTDQPCGVDVKQPGFCTTHQGSPMGPPPTCSHNGLAVQPHWSWHGLPGQLQRCLHTQGASACTGIGDGATLPGEGGDGGIGDVTNVFRRYVLSAQRMRRACSSENESMQWPSEYVM